MEYPKNLKYTKDHEWARIEEGVIVIGITDYAQSELGEIVYVDIESEGDELEKEEVFGTIEAVKTVSDLFMPIAGKVVEVNEELDDAPELVNEDPYGKGWLIKIKPDNESDFNELLSVESYKDEIGV